MLLANKIKKQILELTTVLIQENLCESQYHPTRRKQGKKRYNIVSKQ